MRCFRWMRLGQFHEGHDFLAEAVGLAFVVYREPFCSAEPFLTLNIPSY